MRRNPYTQVSVRHRCHSPVPSGQFVRKPRDPALGSGSRTQPQ